MKRAPAANNAGRAATMIRLNFQHLKKAIKMAAMQVAIVINIRLIFYPVAPSIAVILVATRVTS